MILAAPQMEDEERRVVVACAGRNGDSGGLNEQSGRQTDHKSVATTLPEHPGRKVCRLVAVRANAFLPCRGRHMRVRIAMLIPHACARDSGRPPGSHASVRHRQRDQRSIGLLRTRGPGNRENRCANGRMWAGQNSVIATTSAKF